DDAHVVPRASVRADRARTRGIADVDDLEAAEAGEVGTLAVDNEVQAVELAVADRAELAHQREPARELVLEAEAFAARGVRALAALGIEAEVSGRERTVGQHARGVRRHERGLAEDKLRALEVARAVRPRVERVAVLRVVIVLVTDAAEPG